MAKINENMVVIIGGEYSETNVIIVDINNNFSMSYGPKIINERYMHTCGTFKNNGKTNVIVAGGYNGTNMVNMTEIWDPTTEFGWIEGIQFTIWYTMRVRIGVSMSVLDNSTVVFNRIHF